jgi:membrane associated rhomboid family serine protease
MGRSAIHVGASSLIFGYFGFLVFRGLIKRSLAAMAISILTIAVYGGLVWGIFPGVPGISWEGHLFGLLAGVVCARMDA